ncbi:MAG: flagellar hook-associated protein FlgK [Azoarcus sp.]|nr:flagellar hook-associated protein FlgK [Azoarcus sp.]
MAGLLNIGLTGLNAAQSQLSTTSHNITNAATPGYHRQSVIQTTQDPSFSGAGFFGNGTRISAVTRSYSQFLDTQVLLTESRQAEYSTYSSQIRQINGMLADATSGLGAAMDAFFAGVQEVAANPTNTASRQALLSGAQTLVSRFQLQDNRLSEIRDGVESELRSTVEQINGYAESIAAMNRSIAVAQSAGPGVPVNDLLDQRGQLVTELNRLVKVSAIAQDDGSLTVFVGSGQSLVTGQSVSKLAAVPTPGDAERSSIALVAANGSQMLLPDTLLTGGSLGGLLAFRRDSLDPAQRELGVIAAGLATAFNAQHQLGVDLDGALGQAFFSVSPRVVPETAATVALDPANIGALTGSDYQLANVGGTYTLTNLSTKASVTVVPGVPQNFEGITVTAAALAAGETALIQPTRYAARDIAVTISDTRQVAAGSPVSGNVPLSNVGNAKLSNIVMTDTSGVLSPPWAATLTFDDGTTSIPPVPPGFSLPPGFTPATLDYNPATESAGKVFTLTGPGGFSLSFTLSGSPANGDTLTLQPSEKGVADNRNVLALGALQTAKLLYNAGSGAPTTSLGGAYSKIVSAVGNKTREVQANEAAQTSLLTQARDARDSLSGVNLDEEAANLVRYQQAYQASARVMTIAQRLFDEVLSIAR